MPPESGTSPTRSTTCGPADKVTANVATPGGTLNITSIAAGAALPTANAMQGIPRVNGTDQPSYTETSAGVWQISKRLKLSGDPLDLDLGIDHSVLGSADYDGDGSTDLLVFNPATRELVLWLMGEAGAHSFESLGTITTDWLPVGFNTDDAAN